LEPRCSARRAARIIPPDRSSATDAERLSKSTARNAVSTIRRIRNSAASAEHHWSRPGKLFPRSPPGADPPIRASDAPADENLEGERKTATALFADIKGSTELEQDLEEVRAIVDPAFKLMIDAVRRYDGYVVQSTGDGIFAILGAPVAHEHHPQRALYAALRMQEELRRYSAKLVAEAAIRSNAGLASTPAKWSRARSPPATGRSNIPRSGIPPTLPPECGPPRRSVRLRARRAKVTVNVLTLDRALEETLP
jgi:predicted  nucleic acid-binding Zn-ribbon protein